MSRVSPRARAWAATPQARFERLLRATSVPVGLLTNGAEFRLVYTPRGEASGHATFKLSEMRESTGRPILSAFLMLLRAERMFGDPDSRLTRLLEESRRYQTEVSEKLATQVLEGLYELLRGLHAADLRTGSTLLADSIRRDPTDGLNWWAWRPGRGAMRSAAPRPEPLRRA
ncbi:MAG TPA: type IIL restriction-modification enzyme MmeI [Acetobacteraceae bacterium]